VTPYELITTIADGKLDFAHVSEEERKVLQQATSYDPQARYPSAKEMVSQLRLAVQRPRQRVGSDSEDFFLSPDPAPGVEIVPHFRLVGRLGVGGFGEVWEAKGPGDVPAAIKIITNLQGLGGLELRALELIRNVRHPHLMQMHGFWLIDDQRRI